MYGSTTRGNVFKSDKGRAKYDLLKYYFTNMVVNAWNSLPDHVVLSETIKSASEVTTVWRYRNSIIIIIIIIKLLNCYLINFGNIKI